MPLDSEFLETDLQIAVRGQVIENWLSSDIGVYITKSMENLRESAINSIKTVSPWRRKRILQLQNDIWRAETFGNLLAEAVMSGRVALEKIEGEND